MSVLPELRRRGGAARIGVLVAAVLLAGAGTADYVVERGDTLSQLAARFGTSVDALAQHNGIADPDRIVAGQRLVVPGSDPAPSSAASPGHHVVRPGETLSAIAARYGIPADRLAAANGIADHRRVWAGSRLLLSTEAPALPSPGSSTEHRIAPGETLSHVAARFGVSVAALAAANGVTDPDRVVAGRVLRIGAEWRCPVAGITRMVDDFGAPRSGGRFHDGIDLFAPAGSPVVAPVAGSIEYVSGPIGGLQFVLMGDDGHRYIGSHLARGGSPGRVTAGADIGAVGSSGNAVGSPPHLHFEVHPGGGSAANPFSLLAAVC
ncbi:MAG TPA: M23 family metallopeptidase [Acidimicrobiia bacterium]|nr:M23 family metallopeptidase [Acidimicrobiia bacterium]